MRFDVPTFLHPEMRKSAVARLGFQPLGASGETLTAGTRA